MHKYSVLIVLSNYQLKRSFMLPRIIYIFLMKSDHPIECINGTLYIYAFVYIHKQEVPPKLRGNELTCLCVVALPNLLQHDFRLRSEADELSS